MRTIDEIYNSLLERKDTFPELSDLNSTSKVSIWRNLLWVIAFGIFIHENIFYQHKAEVLDLIDNDKAHTPLWYRNMVLDFQFGFSLIPGSDLFDNSTANDEQIAASKIIKNAAVEEPEDESVLIIKVAKDNAGIWEPLSETELAGLDFYISRVKDSGVAYRLINFLPDKLVLNLIIKRDPYVIDENGVSILNGNLPVKDSLNNFKKKLPFNGELILNKLVDELQKIEGVINPTLSYAKTSWIDAIIDDYGEYKSIYISKIPVSGYFEIDWENSNIDYVV